MKTLFKTDKNGTKFYADYTCPRCGGRGGSDAWAYTGWTCYACGGSGRSDKPSIEKVYTPEYRAILNKKLADRQAKMEAERLAKRIAEAESYNLVFLSNNFWSEESIEVLIGDTYNIREELKTEGCKFVPQIGWYSKTVLRPSFTVMVEDLVEKDETGTLVWSDAQEVKKYIDTLRAVHEHQSEYQGEIGQRLTLGLKVKRVYEYGVRSFSGYGVDMRYINTMVDSDNNVFVWKTGVGLHEGQIYKVVGTVKEHSEYNGVKQTLLTRCKVEEIKEEGDK